MTEPSVLRVVIAEDNYLVREGVGKARERVYGLATAMRPVLMRGRANAWRLASAMAALR